MGCFIYARHDPSSPVIDSVTDPSPCEQSGVQINFTAGKAANRHDLYKDGSLAVQSYSSGAAYDPGDMASHTYTVRAVNTGAGRFTDSTGINGADADVTPGEVASFTNLCSWDAVAGATGYKVYRGTYATMPNLMTSTADGCLRCQGAETSFDCSSDDPSQETDKLYWYLVTALTGTCEGTAGNATGGPRFVNANVICE